MVAIKYEGGVLMACDTLLSYGSLAKLPHIPRIAIVNQHTAIAASGDYADFQEATKMLKKKVLEESLYDDGIVLTPSEVFSFMHRTLYADRSDLKPMLCNFVIIGSTAKESFLGVADNIGTRWTDSYAATGLGAHMAVPLLRRALEIKGGAFPSRDEALNILQDCMRTLFYHECRTINRFQVADASNGRVVISEPAMLETKWDYAGFAFEKTAIIA